MLKRVFSVILSVFMMTSAVSAEEFADEIFSVYEGVISGEGCTFLVELDGGGVLERSQNGSLSLSSYQKSRSYNELEALHTAALKTVSSVTETEPQGRLTHIMNGIIIEGNTADLERLESLPNVKTVRALPKLQTIEPASDFGKTEADDVMVDFAKLQTMPLELEDIKNQYTGKGTVIGIVDSELWYDHTVFDTEPESPRLSLDDIAAVLSTESLAAENKVSTLSAGDVYISSKIPFVFDYADNDCDPKSDNAARYHGTHVSGIAAAKSAGYSGIAPDAQLVFAKTAFDKAEKGSIDVSSVLYALDDMVKLDVDVINISLGIAAGFSDGGIFDGVFETLESSGICVVASAGNDGSFGNELKTGGPLAAAPDYGLIGQPGSCEYSTAVASYASAAMFNKLILADGTMVEYQDSSFQYSGTSFDMLINNGTVPYTYCGMGTEEAFEEVPDLSGCVAVISRGGAAFSDSIGRAEEKGAIAAVIINNTKGCFFIQGTGFNVPAVVVSNEYGDSIINAEVKELTVNRKSNKPSSFSSRGATPGLKLKPEVSAVGACVYSAAYDDSFAVMDGTSQAAPQYSGSCAAILEYIQSRVNPDMSKAAMHLLATQLLASGAVPKSMDGDASGIPASPRIQGAGVINLKNAVASPAVLYNTYNRKTKVELGQLSGNSFSFEFVIQNTSDRKITYDLSADVITDDYKTVLIDGQSVNLADQSRYLESAETTFDCGASVTVGPNCEEYITVTVTVSEEELSALKEVFVNGIFVEGYVRLTADALPEISIPFMGFHGDWCRLPAFNSSDYGLSNSFYVKVQGGASALIKDNGVLHYSPSLGAFLARIQNTRNLSKLMLTIKNANDEVVYGAGYRYVPKMYNMNLSAEIDAFKGIGNIKNEELPDGRYTAVISAIPVCPDGHTHEQQLRLDIYIDRSTPQMLNAYIENDTVDGVSSLWLKLSAEDSPADASKKYVLIDPTQNYVPCRYISETNEYAFNIKGYSLPYCRIQLSDAAQNTASYGITRANGYAKSFLDGVCTDIEGFNALVANGILLNRFYHNATGETPKRLYAFDDKLRPLTEPYDVTDGES